MQVIAEGDRDCRKEDAMTKRFKINGRRRTRCGRSSSTVMKTLGGGYFELVAWIAGSLSFVAVGMVAIHYIGWRAAVAVVTSVAIGGLLRKSAQNSWVIIVGKLSRVSEGRDAATPQLKSFERRIELESNPRFSSPFVLKGRLYERS